MENPFPLEVGWAVRASLCSYQGCKNWNSCPVRWTKWNSSSRELQPVNSQPQFIEFLIPWIIFHIKGGLCLKGKVIPAWNSCSSSLSKIGTDQFQQNPLFPEFQKEGNIGNIFPMDENMKLHFGTGWSRSQLWIWELSEFSGIWKSLIAPGEKKIPKSNISGSCILIHLERCWSSFKNKMMEQN